MATDTADRHSAAVDWVAAGLRTLGEHPGPTDALDALWLAAQWPVSAGTAWLLPRSAATEDVAPAPSAAQAPVEEQWRTAWASIPHDDGRYSPVGSAEEAGRRTISY